MSNVEVKKGTNSELKECLVNQWQIDWFQSSFKQVYPEQHNHVATLTCKQ